MFVRTVSIMTIIKKIMLFMFTLLKIVIIRYVQHLIAILYSMLLRDIIV